MGPTASLEFLLVSSNYQTLTAVAGGLKETGGNLGFVPSTASAQEYISRRKVDGIFIDLDVPGAQDLILHIREGDSNRSAVVFACLPASKESPVAVVAGASYLLQKPLSAESIRSHMTVAHSVMVRERRRFFRHPLTVPVTVTAEGKDQRGMMTNLGEGGMAVRVTQPLRCPAAVDFIFELFPGMRIDGKGLIAWAHKEGMIGVRFHLLRGDSQDRLQAWLQTRLPAS
jgi:hypothetical protein